MAVEYLRVYALCSPLTTCVFALDNFLRISGFIRGSMALNILMSVLCGGLEFFFLGVCGWGVWAAALAGSLGMSICAIIAYVPFLRTIPGLEDVKIMRPGYAIEYDCLDPTQLTPWLEVKKIAGLFSAGQANGTSGYEEAAAQGLMAGINAALKIKGKEPFILTRSEAYIGVLIDDLVTKGTNEPYRIMTSRSEYRLILRQDNADLRLTQKGYDLGLVTQERYDLFTAKKKAIDEGIAALKAISVTPSKANLEKLAQLGTAPIHTAITAYDLLRRSDVNYEALRTVFDLPELTADVEEEIEIMIKYEGYISRQLEQVEKMNRLEQKKMPADIVYADIDTLSAEARQKLDEIRPVSLGQASRISGVSPADITALLIVLEQRSREEKSHVSH